jgi:hypothetical protein
MRKINVAAAREGIPDEPGFHRCTGQLETWNNSAMSARACNIPTSSYYNKQSSDLYHGDDNEKFVGAIIIQANIYPHTPTHYIRSSRFDTWSGTTVEYIEHILLPHTTFSKSNVHLNTDD